MRKIFEAVLAAAIIAVGGSTAAVISGVAPEPVEQGARQVAEVLRLDGLLASADRVAGETAGARQDAERRGGWGGATDVTVGPVRLEPLVNRFQAIGTGRAANSVTVATSVAGLVETVHFASNSLVGAGDPLVTLDRDAEAIALEGAEATYAQAKAANDRYQASGLRSTIFSEAQIEEVRTALAVAEAALKQARFEHGRRVIRAPFAGRVGLDDLAVGQHLAAGAEVVRLDDASALEVEFLLPEAAAAEAVPGAPVRAMGLAMPGRIFEGEITATDSHIDPESRTLRVRATIPNPDQVLRPGMTFSVTVAVEGEAIPVVPALAVQWSREGAFVWRVVGDAVERVPVVIAKREGDAVFVRAEMAEGDRVAVEGAQKLNDSSTVRAEPPARATPEDAAPMVEAPALRLAPVPAAHATSSARAVR